MKKLLLLLSLTLVTTLAFGQATGKDFTNYPTSGSIGTAATTVDVYSRININQTTAGITLTVPNPTNTTTKVTEVWIGNKGTEAFTLVPGGVIDTSMAVILKWTGTKYYVVGMKPISSVTSIEAIAPLSYVNDTLRIDTTKVPYFSGGISGPKNAVTYQNGLGVWDTISAGGVVSVAGTTNRITSTGGSAPVIDISSSYVGQASITTLGTIGTGVWQGTSVADAYIASAATWNAKQSALVSGTNIKTLYGATLLGSGDAGIAPPTYGGTGINNGTNTLTLAGNTAFTGAFNPTFAIPRTTTWSLPNTANETLAGLGTAQDFTAVNRFSSTSGTEIYSLKIWDTGSGSYDPAISGVSGQLTLAGLGASMGINLSTNTICNGVFYVNQVQPTTGGGTITIGSTGLSIFLTTNTRSTASAVKTGYQLRSGNHTGAVFGANTQNMEYVTGSTTSGSATGSTTGSHLFDVGTTTAGNTRGGVSFFAGFSTAATEPAWNSGERIMYIGNRTASPTTNATAGTYFYANAGNLETTGSFYFPLIGTGIGIKTGTNGRLFTATLTAGTVTVSNTSVTANTRALVNLAPSGASGTLGYQYTYTCTAGQIVVTALNSSGATETADVSTVQVYLIEGL